MRIRIIKVVDPTAFDFVDPDSEPESRRVRKRRKLRKNQQSMCNKSSCYWKLFFSHLFFFAGTGLSLIYILALNICYLAFIWKHEMSEKVLTHLLNCINDRHFAYLKIGNYYLQTPRLGFRVIAKLCAYGIFKQFLNNISFLLSAYFICSLTFLKVQLAIGPSHKKTGCHHELPVPVFLTNLNLRCVQCRRINHDHIFFNSHNLSFHMEVNEYRLLFSLLCN
jgi:hypothetical protein